MLDPMLRSRQDFREGTGTRLSDGQVWILPRHDSTLAASDRYQGLVRAIVTADNRNELFRAELALGIHLILLNYDVPPLILGALLDFPEGEPALQDFQVDLHMIAMEHVRAYRSPSDTPVPPLHSPRIPRKFSLFNRADASLSA
jgi:hypothetical protein